MFAFITSPVLAFIGPLVTVVFQWVARLFIKSGAYRILGMILMIDVLFITVNKVFAFFLLELKTRLGANSLPPDVCWVFDTVGLFTIISFYISTLMSFAMARYFIKLSTRLMS